MKPSFFPSLWKVIPSHVKLLLLSSLPLAAAPTKVTGLVVGPATVTLTFENDGSSNQFTLQKNLGLDLGNWSNAGNAVLTPLGAGRYTFAVPRTAADKQFYRILSTLIIGTALDRMATGWQVFLKRLWERIQPCSIPMVMALVTESSSPPGRTRLIQAAV